MELIDVFLATAFLFLAVVVSLGAIFGTAIFFLWNFALVPLGLPVITFWQALGFYAFASILAIVLRSRR